MSADIIFMINHKTPPLSIPPTKHAFYFHGQKKEHNNKTSKHATALLSDSFVRIPFHETTLSSVFFWWNFSNKIMLSYVRHLVIVSVVQSLLHYRIIEKNFRLAEATMGIGLYAFFDTFPFTPFQNVQS